MPNVSAEILKRNTWTQKKGEREGQLKEPHVLRGDSGKDPPPVKQKPRSQGIEVHDRWEGDPTGSPGKGSFVVLLLLLLLLLVLLLLLLLLLFLLLLLLLLLLLFKQQSPEGRTEPAGNDLYCLTLLSEPRRKVAVFELSKLRTCASATPKQQGPEGRKDLQSNVKNKFPGGRNVPSEILNPQNSSPMPSKQLHNEVLAGGSETGKHHSPEGQNDL